jgi:hypothetical protein
MANNNKTQKEESKFSKISGKFKAAGWLVEVVARSLTAYLVLTNFTNIVAVAVGWYMLVTAAIIIVSVFAKAFKD